MGTVRNPSSSQKTGHPAYDDRPLYSDCVLRIDASGAGSTQTLTLHGRLRWLDDESVLRAAVLAAIETGAERVVLDISEINQIDSYGIGEIVAAYTTLRNRGVGCELEGASPKVSEVLNITQLGRLFDKNDD